MKRKLLILGLIFSVAINIGVLGTIGYNWLKEQNHQEYKHSLGNFLCRELGLSESQSKEMESLRKSLEPQINKIKKELREKRAQLVNLLMESDPDQEKINISLKEIGSLQIKLQRIVIYHLLEQKKILSQEQQKKLFSIILERLCPKIKHQGKCEHK
jgi:Spy/CpxP family protein refolding chaperone